MSDSINYLRSNINEVLCFKLKNGRTIFGKLESILDKSKINKEPESPDLKVVEDFEIIIAAPIEMVTAIMPTQQGPAPIEMPLPYFSVSPSSSIPFMKDELSMMAEATKELADTWLRANTPIDLESKIQLT